MENAKNNHPFPSTGLRIARTAMPDNNKTLRHDLKENLDQFYPVLSENSKEISVIVDEKGKIKYCNQAVSSLLQYDSTKLIGNNFNTLIPIDQSMVFRAALRASAAEGDTPIEIDCQLLNRESHKAYFRLSITDLRHHPHIEGYLIHARDISRLKYQEEKLKISKTVLACIEEAMVVVNWKNKRIEYANEPFYQLSGFTKEDIFGGKLNIFEPPYSNFLFAEETDFKQIKKFRKRMQNNEEFEGRVYSKCKNGEVFYNRLKIVPIMEHKEEPEQYFISIRKIKSRK